MTLADVVSSWIIGGVCLSPPKASTSSRERVAANAATSDHPPDPGAPSFWAGGQVETVYLSDA
jgi:hypothetical protein